jgi:hypothetical protein
MDSTSSWYIAVWPAVTIADVAPTLGGSMAKSVATPMTETDCGVSCPLSPSITVALRVPTKLGLNVRLTTQFAVGAMVPLQVSLSRKSVGFAPENVMELIASAPLPVFVTVTASGWLAVPTSWLVKFTIEGKMETTAW